MSEQRHKTVSIPQGAYDRLFELREAVSTRRARLPEHAQAFVNQHEAGAGQKYTFGMVFWLACEMALAELNADEANVAPKALSIEEVGQPDVAPPRALSKSELTELRRVSKGGDGVARPAVQNRLIEKGLLRRTSHDELKLTDAGHAFLIASEIK